MTAKTPAGGATMTEADLYLLRLYGAELEFVRKRRAAARVTGPDWDFAPGGSGAAAGAGHLVGLALSGGGLRSALFNRGLLEALSKRGLLKYVDVCASVSGGGFIAGYLAALGERARAAGAADFHANPDYYRFGTEGSGRTVKPRDGGADPHRSAHAGEYLRDVSGVFGRWLLGTLPVLLMFLSGIAAFSAAAALVWRGADTVWFRQYVGTMGIGDFGSDAAYALLPLLPVGLGWLAVQFAATRRTAWAAGLWLFLFPWAAGTLLCVPLLRAAGLGAAFAWAAAVAAAAAIPICALYRLEVRRRAAAGDGAEGGPRSIPAWVPWAAAAGGAVGLLVLAGVLLEREVGDGVSGDLLWAGGPATAAVAVTLLLCQAVPAFALPALIPREREYVDPDAAREPPGRLRRPARLATLALLAAVLVTLAVFLGNGINSVGRTSTDDTSWRWESWAGTLGLAAGVVQLITVLGFDSLFRSQQATAPPWQRSVFRLVLSVVLGLPIFTVLHFLAGEDVSRHGTERRPDLKAGDVFNYAAFAAMVEEVGPLTRAILPLKPDDLRRTAREVTDARDSLVGERGEIRRLTTWDGIWDRFCTVYLGTGGEGIGPSRQFAGKTWDDHRAALTARARTWDAALRALNGDPLTREQRARYHHRLSDDYGGPWSAPWWGDSESQSLSPPPGRLADEELTRELVGSVARRAESMGLKDRRELDGLLVDPYGEGPDPRDYRLKFDDFELTLSVPPAGSESEAPKRWTDTRRRRLAEAWILQRAAAFGGRDAFDLKQYWARATHHGLDDRKPLSPGETGDHLDLEDFREHERARFNHLMLAALFPAAVKGMNEPSTSLVVLPDQRFRFDTLLLAGGSFAFLLAGWVDFNRHSPSFQFYRDALRDHFLGPAALPALPGAKGDFFDPKLEDLDPYAVGLPYPLYVATLNVRRANVWFGPLKGGRPAVHPLPRPVTEHLPFVFGPVYCGGAAVGMQATKTYAGGALRLSDAITASGSAVSPYFTDHPWLTWFMTAVNLRLGVWLPRPDGGPGRPAVAAPGPAERTLRRAICNGHDVTDPVGGRGAYARRFLRYWATRCTDRLAERYDTPPAGGYAPPARLPAAGALPVLREYFGTFTRSRVDDFELGFVADGGFRDNLGVEQLLARKCRLIVASDAGYNHGSSEFTALATLVALARTELGAEFFDLDADRPLDLDRFKKGADRLAPQQVLALRVRYADGSAGLLMYCQMALTGREENDLRQARESFPNFPDEPTGNQMYSDAQVELYRRLGAHVGEILCRNLPRAEEPGDRARVLAFDDLCERLTLSYVQECAAEGAVADGEASAGRLLGAGAGRTNAVRLKHRTAAYFFPNFQTTDEAARRQLADRLGMSRLDLGGGPTAAEREADLWLQLYDRDADFRLYHDARVWRRLRGDGGLEPWEPAHDPPAGGKARDEGVNESCLPRVLSPGHVAVAYMACARRADIDPPAEHMDLPNTDSDRHQRTRDWQPFAAGGRARLTALVAEYFGQDGRLKDRPAELAHLRMKRAGEGRALSDVSLPARQSDPPAEQPLPHSRTDFPIPLKVPHVHQFLIQASEGVAPERGAVQIAKDLAVWLYREHTPEEPETARATALVLPGGGAGF